MSKKVKRVKAGKKIPGMIEAGKLSARPDHGNLFYRQALINFWMRLTDDQVIFMYSFDKVGLSFDFRIEGEKQVKAFVEFVRKTHEFNTKSQSLRTPVRGKRKIISQTD
jgi:hypothetical protein